MQIMKKMTYSLFAVIQLFMFLMAVRLLMSQQIIGKTSRKY